MSGIDLDSRLHLALTSAMNRFLFVEDSSQIRKVQSGVLNAMVRSRDDLDTDDASKLIFADDEDFYLLTHPVLTTQDGPQVNDLWFNPAFLKPAIAATAQLWERIIRVDGDSLLTLHVSRTDHSLTGFRLDRLEAQTTHMIGNKFLPGDISGKASKDEYLRISTMLAGAAHFILGDMSGDFLRCAINYLISEAAKGGDRPDTGDGRTSSGFIIVSPTETR